MNHASASSPVSVENMPVAHELDFATALQAADAIRRKQISSVELTRRIFERIDRYNPQLNAFVYQLRDDALVRAKKADEVTSAGKESRRISRRSHHHQRKLCGSRASRYMGHSGFARFQGRKKL